MPFYYKLKSENAADRRTAKNLLGLQKLFREGDGEPEIDGEPNRNYVAPVPGRTHRQTLNLATWNIREFDSTAYGQRTLESLYYIAEVISHFDLVAVQEVREDLHALNEVLWILGNANWDYVVTDVTEGQSGNKERMAFLYDKRKINPTGLVGQIVLPPNKGNKKKYGIDQFARTPFLVGFQAGWFKFSLCTVHMIYGGDAPSPKRRLQEIDALARFLSERAKKYRGRFKAHEYRNVALLGDFNIYTTEDDTFKALGNHGFTVPESILGKTTNIGKKARAFDQIAFLENKEEVQYTGLGGVMNFYQVVYRPEDQGTYRYLMRRTIKESNEKKKAKSKSAKLSAEYDDRTEQKQKTYYNSWKTYQISDHLPLWVQLKIDFSEDYLLRKSKKPASKKKSTS